MKYFRIRPVLAIPSVLLVLYGFWLLNHPVAYILGGLCLLAASSLQGKPVEKPKDGK